MDIYQWLVLILGGIPLLVYILLVFALGVIGMFLFVLFALRNIKEEMTIQELWVRREINMATPLDPREIVTVQGLAISNMLEIKALRKLVFEFEKRIITGEELLAQLEKLD